MTPEEIKTLKVMFATFKFDIAEIVEEKFKELIKEKRKPKVELGYP